jgi:hypothetical protein
VATSGGEPVLGPCLADASHRKRGWWAFDCLNGGTASAALALLSRSAADFAAFQETRVAADDVEGKRAAAAQSKWNL